MGFGTILLMMGLGGVIVSLMARDGVLVWWCVAVSFTGLCIFLGARSISRRRRRGR